MNQVYLYHRYSENTNSKFLDDKIISDLNINDLFERLDFTSSSIGKQYLWHLLCKGEKTEIATYEKYISWFSQNKDEREAISKVLFPLDNSDAFSIIDVIKEERQEPSSSYMLMMNILRWLPLLFVIMFLTSKMGVLIFFAIAAYIANGYIHFKKKDEMIDYFFSVPQITILFEIAEKLNHNSMVTEIFPEINKTVIDVRPLKKRLKKFKFFIKLEGGSAMIAYIITEFFNIFFLIAAMNIINSFIYIRREKGNLELLYKIVALLDVLCSISYVRDNMSFCNPSTPTNNEFLRAKNIYHPIIDYCVKNDLILTNKSALITGSNMSGKTSFIKTIGVNLITAKAINTCFADEYSIDIDREVFSVIDNKDDITDGKSYFMKEVENIKTAVAKAGTGNNVFILDELLKGTNTTERIAINFAVLDYLAKCGNIVLTSTHDYKLTSMLIDRYELYHFCETVEDGKLSFDYKIKEGIVKEGNAIKILQLCNYPDEIIEVAKREAAL